MATRSTIAISPRQIINYIGLSILCLQGVFAQQCLNNGMKHTNDPLPPLSKTSCNLNQANSGHNIHASQQANMHQINFQQPSNIQQASFMQQAGNVQPQWNLQQTGSQPSANSMSNSQTSQQHSQNYASQTFSSLKNVRPAHGTYIAQSNAYQQASSQPSSDLVSKTQNGNQFENQQFQTTFTFQPIQTKSSSTNTPIQQIVQNNQPQNPSSYLSAQNFDHNGQNQPPSSSPPQQHLLSPLQATMVTAPNPQTKSTPQAPPIILTLQAPQMIPVQSIPTSATSQTGLNQPIVYVVQTPSSSNQNPTPIVIKQGDRPNNRRPDESVMTYMMSQIQNQLGSDNALASILPAILSTKSEKSSLKALLPLIFNILNEKGNGCVCPHCGCNNNNQIVNQEPVINSGYSNKNVYRCQESANEVLNTNTDTKIVQDSNANVIDSKNYNDATSDDFGDVSDEDEDEEEDSEEYFEDE